MTDDQMRLPRHELRLIQALLGGILVVLMIICGWLWP
jgi:hypothetical protein